MLTDHRIKRLWNIISWESKEKKNAFNPLNPHLCFAVGARRASKHQNKKKTSTLCDGIISLSLTLLTFSALESAFIVSWFHQLLNSSTWKRLKTTCLILLPATAQLVFVIFAPLRSLWRFTLLTVGYNFHIIYQNGKIFFYKPKHFEGSRKTLIADSFGSFFSTTNENRRSQTLQMLLLIFKLPRERERVCRSYFC